MGDEAGRRAVVEACRAMRRMGLSGGTSGNVSVRAEGGMLISPTGMDYDAMGPGDVVPVRWDGSFEGAVRPSSEWRFHLDLLRARPELGAVVHTHSRCATAVAILGRGIPAIHYTIAAAGGADVRCAPYALFGTAELAAGVVEAMRGRTACLMAHHGAIAAGATVEKALELAATVEELAEQYLMLLPMGEPPVLGAEEMGRVVERFRTYGQQAEGVAPGRGGSGG